jgi:hypothetical protein
VSLLVSAIRYAADMARSEELGTPSFVTSLYTGVTDVGAVVRVDAKVEESIERQLQELSSARAQAALNSRDYLVD